MSRDTGRDQLMKNHYMPNLRGVAGKQLGRNGCRLIFPSLSYLSNPQLWCNTLKIVPIAAMSDVRQKYLE